jgi:hypothetical protein
MARLFTKENFARLEPWERGRVMELQTARGYSGRSAFLPDDCSECGACGEPTLGSGWCDGCYAEWERLSSKMRGESR